MEPISITLVSFSAILSIAASISQIAAARKISREKALEEFEDNASIDEREMLTDPQIRLTILALTIISPDLLDQLADEIQQAEVDYIAGRRAAKTIGEKDKFRMKSIQIICSSVRDISSHTGGSLPENDKLKNWSTSYN